MRSIILSAALALAGAAQAQTLVLDTFNEADPSALFDCCNVLSVNGKDGKTERVTVAVPFTATTFLKISEIDAALSSTTPFRPLKIEIAGSTMGLPGKVKHSWQRQAPDVGQCCTYMMFTSGQATHAEAGGQYWIVLKGVREAVGGWNLNSAGLSGQYAVKTEREWHLTSGPLPALRVYAK